MARASRQVNGAGKSGAPDQQVCTQVSRDYVPMYSWTVRNLGASPAPLASGKNLACLEQLTHIETASHIFYITVADCCNRVIATARSRITAIMSSTNEPFYLRY